MFKSFKGRTVEVADKVEVYRNLHNGKWSIRSAESGLVLGHAEVVTLMDCEFVVNEKGRQRVLREQKKNVHAVIKGSYLEDGGSHLDDEVTYNPYLYETFVMRDGEQSVLEADCVHLGDDSRVTIG